MQVSKSKNQHKAGIFSAFVFNLQIREFCGSISYEHSAVSNSEADRGNRIAKTVLALYCTNKGYTLPVLEYNLLVMSQRTRQIHMFHDPLLLMQIDNKTLWNLYPNSTFLQQFPFIQITYVYFKTLSHIIENPKWPRLSSCVLQKQTNLLKIVLLLMKN